MHMHQRPEPHHHHGAPGDEPFLPGMTRRWLMPLYDPLTRLMGARRLHKRLVGLAGIRPGERVLDLGCGTGNLALLVARSIPGVPVTGVDPDRTALRRAERKARRRRATVTFEHGYGHALPLGDASVDHVVSALVLHHVHPDRRDATAAEIARVLRPGGTVTVLDFGAHGHGGTTDAVADDWRVRDNLDDGIPRLLTGAGLVDVTEVGADRAHRLPLTFVQGRKPV